MTETHESTLRPHVRRLIQAHAVFREDHDDPTFLTPAHLDTLQSEKLRRQLALLARTSPAYSPILSPLKDRLDGFTRDDLARLPLTTKDDIQKDPNAYRLSLDESDPYNRLWGLVHTTGTTTGTPTPFFDTGHDMFAYWQMLLRTCKIAGVTPDDVNVSLMPIPPVSHNAFISSRDACSALTAPYIAAFVGAGHPEFHVRRRTDYAISLIEKHKATVLWGIASYVRHLLVRAAELGADCSHVRIVWALGEPCPQVMRDDMKSNLQALGAGHVMINNGLGSTEMRGTMVECRELGGCHNPAPNLLLWETIDPETHEPVADGAQGALVLTHIDRRGTALLRYLTGDLATMTRELCPHCGRSGERMLPTLGSAYAVRIGEEVKFKGLLVRPIALVEALARCSGIGEYQVVFTKESRQDPFSLDRLVVRAEARDGDHPDREAREEEIKRQIYSVSEIRADVEWLDRAEIFDADATIKAKRFVDERPPLEGS
jgi:phenylacetate-CoA ligase